MQVPQSVGRNARYAERHAGADAGIEHPLRQDRDDAGFDLDVKDPHASTPLAVLGTQTPAVERVPAIVNFNFPPDMGRMNR